MGSIAIVLNPEKLKNPDLDLRYILPDTISELTKGEITDDGYDYLDDKANSLVIFMKSINPRKDINTVISILKNNSFIDNNLCGVAKLYISKSNDETNLHKYEVISWK